MRASCSCVGDAGTSDWLSPSPDNDRVTDTIVPEGVHASLRGCQWASNTAGPDARTFPFPCVRRSGSDETSTGVRNRFLCVFPF
jgi:hypothetical protein